MRTDLKLATLVLSIPLLIAGCGQRSSTPTPPLASSEASASADPRVPLEWIEQGIAHQGLEIALGYRGEGLLADDGLEPVAEITRDGKPVADAMVFHRLVSANGRETMGDETATIYEPSPDRDKALYAQSKLQVPEGTSSCVVRFRIVLADADQEWTRDLTISAR